VDLHVVVEEEEPVGPLRRGDSRVARAVDPLAGPRTSRAPESSTSARTSASGASASSTTTTSTPAARACGMTLLRVTRR
jgi:hypothetical protein